MAEPFVGDSPFARQPIDEVWRQFRRSRDEDIRNYLVQKYLHLVRYGAERLSARLPGEVDIDDLHSAGQFGLINAVERFDPDRQVKFETFCASGIRGAMVDELRHMDWAPRLARQRQATVERARRQLAQQFGRPPTSDEIRDALGLDKATFERTERDSRIVGTISINRKSRDDAGEEMREFDLAADGDADDPVRRVQRQDLQDLITRGLSRAERLIIILYYYEGLTMKEIGATLDLSESRVSQMHSSILLRLKAQMRDHARELEPAR